MPVSSASTLVDALRQYRLLEPAQMDEVSVTLQACFPEPIALAGELIRRGWLTPYQCNRLLQGKGRELLLGSYVLLERLGGGGMGEVFKARNWKLGRGVALKVIRKERLANPDAVRRFQREVRSAAALVHPNIVLAHDADLIAGTHLLVMEYVDGIDLARLLKKSGPLPVAVACDFIRQVALGLQHAFERGMVHRDIKPANLLLSADGKTVKILDMGLARLEQTEADDGQSTAVTQDGVLVGTPDYIAPEQALEAHTVDIRADLYSLGCTFYFLLAGRVPFPGSSMIEKLLKHRLEEPRPLPETRPDVPPEVVEVVRRLMAKQPENRYQTPAEVVAALVSLDLSEAPAAAAYVRQPFAATDASTASDTRDSFDSAMDYIARRDDTAALEGSGRRRRQPRSPALLLGLGGGALGLACVTGLLFWLFHRPPAANRKDDDSKVVVPTPPKEDDRPKTPAELLDGKWYYLGPFDNARMKGFDTVYPPEKEIDFEAVYQGKADQQVRWKILPGFQLSAPVSFLPLFRQPELKEWACIYLYHEIEVAEATSLPITLGSDDTLTLWLNEERLLSTKGTRQLQPDTNFTILKLKPGKNRLLAKICQITGAWGFYIAPRQPLFFEQPGFEPWCKGVADLPAAKQWQAVADKLKKLNPGFDGKVTHKEVAGVVTELSFNTSKVTDISPVRALMGLKSLSCVGLAWNNWGKVANLAPLQGMNLTYLACWGNPIADLSPLQGMNLSELVCHSSLVSDLTPLHGMKLTSLICNATKVADLSPLEEMTTLAHLNCGWTGVTDLSPLNGLRLSRFFCNNTRVADLSPLNGMKLSSFACDNSAVSDLSVMQEMPLVELKCDFKPWRDAEILRSIKTLKTINLKAAAEFWKELDARQAAFEAWCSEVAKLPAAKQAEAVAAKLTILNPKFDGKVTPKTLGNVVTDLQFFADNVTDISPVLALTGLRSLNCPGSNNGKGQLSDLSPLKGMKLTTLNLTYTNVADLAPLAGMPLTSLWCGGTQVADLAPLKGMKLTLLACNAAKVTDLSLLKAMPLKELWCDFKLDRDAEILRAIKTLVKINAKPAAEFWKEAGAKKP